MWSRLIRFETRGETADIQNLVLKKAMNAAKGAAEMFDCSVDTKIMGSASSADSDPEMEPFIHAGAARVAAITNYVREAAFSGSEDATYLMAKVQSHGGKALRGMQAGPGGQGGTDPGRGRRIGL